MFFSSIIVLLVGSVNADVLELLHKKTNPFIPKSYHNTKLIPALGHGNDEPSGFITVNFYSSTQCGTGNMMYSVGLGTDICSVGTNSNGTSVGSIKYTFSKIELGFMTFVTSTYTSNDCSGTSVDNPVTVPSTCFPGDDGKSSYLYSYTTDTTPWKSYSPGLVFQMYDTESHCSEVDVGQFVWYPLNSCLEGTKDDGTATGFSFTSCEDGLYTMTYYEDKYCNSFASAYTTTLPVCVATVDDNDDDDDDESLETNNYETVVCSGV